MMNGQKFCLKWDHFRSSVTSVFNNLRQDGELVDITLCCEGHRIKAHRMMLSACSPYFRELLKENPCQHPVFFLKDTSAEDLRAVIEFVYNGEVNVAQTQLASFIKTAEMLQIRGLSGEDEDASTAPVSGGASSDRRPAPPPPPAAPPGHQAPPGSRSPPAKRRRRSGSPSEVPSRPSAVPPPQSPLQLPRAPSQPTQSQSQEGTATEQARPPPQSPGDIKVEKVDLTEADSDPAGLEAALGRVVSYEGAEADLSSLAADDSLGEAGPSGGLPTDRSMADESTLTFKFSGGRFVCHMCGEHVKDLQAFVRHCGEKHSATCRGCGMVFASTSVKDKHEPGCLKPKAQTFVALSTRPAPMAKKRTAPRKAAKKPPIPDADGVFRCDRCQRGFRALDYLRRHITSQHGDEEDYHPPAAEQRQLGGTAGEGTSMTRPVRQKRRPGHCTKLGCDCGGGE